MQFSRFFRPFSLGLAAAFSLACTPALFAQTQTQAAPSTHLVSPAQLQQQVRNDSAARQENIQTLNKFVSSAAAEKAMKDAKIDPVQVKTAIPTLSSSELAELSARAQNAEQQFAAGRLSVLAISLIIVAVVVIILVAAYH